MNTKNAKFDNAKEKLAGETKETVGKITGNEQLELSGRLQSSKADFKKKTNISNNVEKTKEGIAGKINDMMDKKDAKKEAENSSK